MHVAPVGSPCIRSASLRSRNASFKNRRSKIHHIVEPRHSHLRRHTVAVPQQSQLGLQSVKSEPDEIGDIAECASTEKSSSTSVAKFVTSVIIGNRYSREFVDIPLRNEKKEHQCAEHGCTRVVINVSGMRFETTERTLWRCPNTLLGNPVEMAHFWDHTRHEYFFDRHRPSFQAILYFYQSGGNLCRPMEVPCDVFVNELRFFKFGENVIAEFLGSEGYLIPKPLEQPNTECKRRVWTTFEVSTSSRFAKLLSMMSIFVIVVSITTFCLETEPTFRDRRGCNISHFDASTSPAMAFVDPFFVIETVCIVFFTIEFVIRLWACPNKRQFMCRFLNIIDILSIVPFYATVIVAQAVDDAKERCLLERSASAMGMLRALRIVRIFKLTKHFQGLKVFGQTLRSSAREFQMFAVFFGLAIVMFSTMMYTAEFDPYKPVGNFTGNFTSIPSSSWYVVITMTTVGYGDVVPESTMGKLMGSICVMSGVLVLAIPVPVIVNNFAYYYNLSRGKYHPQLML